jgi:DNA-binding transcriptional regulator PaaX
MKIKTKRKIKNAVKNFSIELLEVLKDLAEGLPEPFESKYEHQKRLRRLMAGCPPKTLNQGLYRLQQQGLIQKKQNKKYFSYQLTLSGYQKLLIDKIIRTTKIRNKNYACIIIFDIPEEKHKHRKFLRQLLLKNGFINLQKSVMISPHGLPKEFVDLLNELGIRQNVTIIHGVAQHF